MTGDDIRQVAERSGVSMRMVEKAARLLGVLDALNRHACKANSLSKAVPLFTCSFGI